MKSRRCGDQKRSTRKVENRGKLENYKAEKSREQFQNIRKEKYILAFFAGSDGIVFENLNDNFASEVQYTEARSFYAYQEHNEMVHGETYSKLIDKYIKSSSEKKQLFEAIQTSDKQKNKLSLIEKFMM